MAHIISVDRSFYNLDTATKFDRTDFETIIEETHLAGPTIPGYIITFTSGIVVEVKGPGMIKKVDEFLGS